MNVWSYQKENKTHRSTIAQIHEYLNEELYFDAVQIVQHLNF